MKHHSKYRLSWLKLLLLLAVLLSGLYFAQRSGTVAGEYKNDFNVYYFAAQEVSAGRTPYENSLGEWTPYLYPPLLAQVLVPFTLLPLPIAAYLWFLINAFSLIAALRMSSQLVFSDQPEASHSPKEAKSISQRFAMRATPQLFVAIITLLILLRFVLDNFDYGQVNLLVVGLAVAHIYFWKRGKKFLSALVLAVAVAIKITPILLLVFHLAKLRFKYALGCVAFITVIVMISFMPFGSQADEAFKVFYSRTIANQQGFDLAYHGNQSLQGAIERISGSNEGNASARLVTRLIGLGLLAFAFLAARLRQNELADILPFYCLSVLLSPLSWKQHFVILLLPLAFLAGQSSRSSGSLARWLSMATLFLLFAFFNLTSPKLIGIAAAEWADAHSLVFAAAFTLFVVLFLLPFAAPKTNRKPA